MSTSRTAWLVEWLGNSGWRQPEGLHYRYGDAIELAERHLSKNRALAVRIRPVRIDAEPCYYSEQPSHTEAPHAVAR